MNVKAWWSSLRTGWCVFTVALFGYMVYVCGGGFVSFESHITADPVERAREKMRNAEEWRHLRWSMGALSSELRGASGNVMDASERYNQALLKRHRKELREATENFARAIWDHDGSPASLSAGLALRRAANTL